MVVLRTTTADAKSASGGGVRGGFAAPRSFLVGFGGEAAKTNQKLGCGAQPHDFALALAAPPFSHG
jgi:hypothetical protein